MLMFEYPAAGHSSGNRRGVWLWELHHLSPWPLGRRERSWPGCRGRIEAQSNRWGELDSDIRHIGVICPTEEWTWGG